MASAAQDGGRPPGRTALSGCHAGGFDNVDGGKPGLVFAELAHLGKINLRGNADMLPAVKTHTGCTALPANNSFVTVGDRQRVWLGPDEFLILCEAGSETHLHSQLMLDLGSVHAAAANVTDSLCALSLRGPAVRQVLAKGCALDLHPDVFTPGMCAQTMLSHAVVTLMVIEGNRFMVICRTSFAPYLHDWLLDAGMEYGVSFRS